jgi:hypothetical protein
MLPPKYASGTAARSSERARLSALHRGARQAVTPGSAPGRVSWNRRVQTGGPSPAPVQRAPRRPVLVPDERGPEAARVRSVSFRPRGPLSLRYQEHPHDGVPYLSEMARLSAKTDVAVKRRRQVTMLRPCKLLESNLFCPISQKRDRPWRNAATCRSDVSPEKIRKPISVGWVERSESHPTCALPRDGGEVGPTPVTHSRGSIRG